METASIDTVVIGAGVVGLAVARALAREGREVIILEAADAIGTETSARNSEVVHAGIYYPQDSLKARFCVAGKKALYTYCDSHGVPYRRCGKLIVATNDSQLSALEALKGKAAANGVDDLQWLSAHEATMLEPQLSCVAALLSPSTGIVDSHAFMLSLLGEAESHGAMVALQSPVERAEVRKDGIRVLVGGESPMALQATQVINCAGLHAPALARSFHGLPKNTVPDEFYCKGSYFTLAGAAPFTHLVYPMPDQAGLGVHITLDLGGQAKFGPDTQWIDEIDYEMDEARGQDFYDAIRTYWPGLEDGAMQPGYTGIRPKIVGPGEAAADFMIQGPDTHGVNGLVNLFGIESPGLTSSLAIADHVVELLT
ncbi:NAD(P)/FAD-dependent oxidoreductase [Aestuariispira ectoiniformans]|uniref:NAD(P)/FAD-dependent oxidoreductase n=1 Tax=Aestuariispira ectoiniformans TaxID=2775080 RepID=UPI00223AAF8A|nr:NAD(P)/FAD-dependent oxidoreductase [Aestuariispira ectoiniformans]